MGESTLPSLRKSLLTAPILNKDGYPYFVHPITDGVPRLEADVLKEIIDYAYELVYWDDIDLLLGIEAMGLPLTAPLSLRTNKPFAVIRKRTYGLDGEIKIDQKTGYSKGSMFINDVQAGEKVIIFDDVISTGGTLGSVIQALLESGVEVPHIITVVEKGDGVMKLRTRFPDISFHSILRVKMVGTDLTILE